MNQNEGLKQADLEHGTHLTVIWGYWGVDVIKNEVS